MPIADSWSIETTTPRVAEICLLYQQVFLLEQIATIDGLTPTQ